jgi:hypothetical protein
MGAGLTSITGLQNLTNLQDFRADWSFLTSIDLSGLTNLTYVDVSDQDAVIGGANCLASINLTGCTSLQSLYIDDNDFSTGFPDLSDCTSLRYFDFDQSNLVGSVDLSNLPALEGFDMNGNIGLTEVIISRTQPLSDNNTEILLNNCALTQTAVDNILLELASGSMSNGYIQLDNDNETGTNATPGQVGRESLFVLNARGWSIDVTNGNHTMLTVARELLEEDICASTYAITQYIVSGSAIEVGNRLYQNSGAWMPAEPSWYRIDGDGSVKFEVSGSQGEIISTAPCGA